MRERFMRFSDQFSKSYTYADIGLVPTKASTLQKREHANTSMLWQGFELQLPIIASPMDSVVNVSMAQHLYQYGLLGILPRGSSIESTGAIGFYVVSIGVTKDYMDKVNQYWEQGVRHICIDVANGFHIAAEKAINTIRDRYGDEVKIIAGNVASVEGYMYLAYAGADAVRVGIGNGSVCQTSITTGVGNGQASLLREIAIRRKNMSMSRNDDSLPAIIADGGIKTIGDIVKAIALGADLIMSGSLFAGTDEAPGAFASETGDMPYKYYAGQASVSIKKNTDYIEGVTSLVPCTGGLPKLVKSIRQGLSSGMAYMNCMNLNELRLLPDENFTILSDAAKTERLPHVFS